MAITFTYSGPKLAKVTKSSLPVVRAAGDAGIIDSFKSETGHRMYPPHAVEQLKQHLARVQSDAAA